MDLERRCIAGTKAEHLGCVPDMRAFCVMNGATGCIMRVTDGGPPAEVWRTPSSSFLDSLDGFAPCDATLESISAGALPRASNVRSN